MKYQINIKDVFEKNYTVKESNETKNDLFHLMKGLKFLSNKMIVGTIKENITSEKEISLTPDSAKNIIGLIESMC